VQSSSQIVTTNKPTTSFLQTGCHSCRPTNSVQALKGNGFKIYIVIFNNLLTDIFRRLTILLYIPGQVGEDIIFPCSLFVSKVPLNPNQPIQMELHSF